MRLGERALWIAFAIFALGCSANAGLKDREQFHATSGGSAQSAGGVNGSGGVNARGREQDFKTNWPSTLMFSDPTRSAEFILE